MAKTSKRKQVLRQARRSAAASRRAARQAGGGALVKPARRISPRATLFLYVQAGGRCEFDGCNEYLLEHYPTETPGNFGEQAHIYAFKESAARGTQPGRPSDINSLSNLMLLCAKCHHLVDIERPQDYPVEVLKRFKRDHEDRIYDLTGLTKDRDTVPVVLKGRIAGHTMQISDEEMQAAVAPAYLKRRQKIEIDLTNLPDRPDDRFWQMARQVIDPRIDELNRLQPRAGRTLRVSVFALAPIPLLVYLGSRLSDKQVVELYQRHRDPESWTWRDGAGSAAFATHERTRGGAQVALLVNVSGQNPVEDVTRTIGNCTIYELAVEGQPATPLVLRTRADLDRFVAEYTRALARIRDAHPGIERLHLFPAVPAPMGIVLGRSRLPKVDPRMLVYDRDHRAGGFAPSLEIT